jgi:Ser/Thr protein kinase RdoA (MazF antagonist)
MDIIEIINQFFPDKLVLNVETFGNGHINSTYKVSMSGEKKEYILQKINAFVFKSPTEIVQNHLSLAKLFMANDELQLPHLVPTKNNKYLLIDDEQEVWRMLNFIENSYSIEVVETDEQAYEAGRGFGWFAKKSSLLDPSEFTEAIPDFHRLSYRLKQLKDAMDANEAGRFESVKDLISFYLKIATGLLEIEKLIDEEFILTRVVHNDTKINNLLFRDEKVIAVIDLDTVGPGTVLYDYGDSIRTISNTASEDEQDLSIVHFSLSAFRAYTSGYLGQMKSILNEQEIQHLHLAPVLMTFIMGIRFLTDYLNGDQYYKTNYNEHNLSRSKVQKKLIEEMNLYEQEMKQAIEDTRL